MARSAVLTGRDDRRHCLPRRYPGRADAVRRRGRLARRQRRPGLLARVRPAAAVRLRHDMVGVWLGLHVPTVEVAQQVVFTVIFPITFLSNAFVPPRPARLAAADRRVEPDEHAHGHAPGPVGQPEPVTPRTGRASTEPVLVTIGWIVLFVAVFAPLSVRKYRSRSAAERSCPQADPPRTAIKATMNRSPPPRTPKR